MVYAMLWVLYSCYGLCYANGTTLCIVMHGNIFMRAFFIYLFYNLLN